MTLFNFTLPKEDICPEQELYFRVRSGNLGSVKHDAESGQLRLKKSACISFDTFFNCFSYSRYVKYTKINFLHVTLNLQGAFRIRLIKHEDGGVPVILSEQIVENGELQGFSIGQELTYLSGLGFLYVELQALSEGAIFSGGYYGTSDIEAHPVKIALIICSYKNEAYVYHNAAQLGKYLVLPENRGLGDRINLLVIDNGQTLEREKILFDKAKLLYNRNLGGSGGFARGMIEAVRSDEKFSHMLLMDDDVRFDPEVIRKTISLLAFVRDEYRDASIGGIMLEMERPYHQHEMGGIWTGRSIINVRSGLDMRLKREVLLNENEVAVDYNAWWYMCMPLTMVSKIGLPMPFFIKGDDMDYGLRASREIILMNGIAVWHEGFGRKYNAALEYYIKRNELILNALHRPRYGMIRELRKMLSSCGKQVVFQRYVIVDLIIKAYEDFLNGADFLIDVDGEKWHRVLMAFNLPKLDDKALADKLKEEYPDINFVRKPDNKPSRLLRILTLYSYLIPRCFYNRKQRYRLIDVTDFCPADFYKAECVIQYDSDMGTGFVSTLDKSEALRFGFNFLRISIKMLFGYRKAVKSYREHQPELTGMGFWVKRLGLPECNE